MVRTVLCTLAVGVVGVVGVAGLAGCTASQPTDQPPGASATVAVADRAQALWAGRTAYVGDSAKVVALVDAAGFGPRGSYSVALWTTRPPYTVTVTLSDPAKPFDTTDLAGPATLLLGTVTNLDTVHVTSAGQTCTLTARQATATLGRDVKTLGTDRAWLEDYVGSLDD